MANFMAKEKAASDKFDPLSAEHHLTPFPLYNKFRQNDPVHWGHPTNKESKGIWYVFSHAHVSECLKDPRLIHDRMTLMPDEVRWAYKAAADSCFFLQLANSFLLSIDPPDHTRLRSLISQAFTPKVVFDLQGEIQVIANQLLRDNVHEGQIELIKGFAGPLPLKVIASMLGIDIGDYEQFSRCSAALSETIESSSPEVIAKAIDASDVLVPLLQELIQKRKTKPANDLISNLVQAECNSQLLSENEIIATCMLLLVAGHETTVNLIGNGFLALLQYPNQLDLLRNKEDLVSNAVEEMLRFDPPGRIATRYASESFELDGNKIQRGERVSLMIASANRDEAVFEHADTFDVTRNASAHLSFGRGIHYCLGAPLARMEAQIAFHSLLKLSAKPALLTDALEWHERVNLRGLKALAIQL